MFTGSSAAAGQPEAGIPFFLSEKIARPPCQKSVGKSVLTGVRECRPPGQKTPGGMPDFQYKKAPANRDFSSDFGILQNMKNLALPAPQLLQVYLDALFQLATGYKPVLSSGAISAFVQSKRTSLREPKQSLVEWCAHNPTQMWDYEPLEPLDIQRLTTLLNSTARMLNKVMPDLKAIEVAEKPTLSTQDQASRIQAILQRAGVGPSWAQVLASQRQPQTIDQLDS